MEQVSIFDLFDDEESERFKPKKATDWKWSFADYPERNGLQVFSCFACGGGSTMGYKLAGCNVLGCCEIDPKMNEVYVKNHNPQYNFLMDIREFNKIPNDKLPSELFSLDILDGSPPCTTFSISGDRENSWGKRKKFREGQAEQTLDDLSFVFIETVEKLRPRCVIMENVKGLILGEAWAYVQRIYMQLKDAGYSVRHWLLKGEHMGVPQKRHRVFFVAIRNDYAIDPYSLDMSFNYKPITYGEIKDGYGKEASPKFRAVLENTKQGEKDLVAAWNRTFNPGNPEKRMWFNHIVINDDDVMQTIAGDHGSLWDFSSKRQVSHRSIANASTFPQDYDFCGESVPYICGMSVPPIMIKRIVNRLQELHVFERMAAQDAGATPFKNV